MSRLVAALAVLATLVAPSCTGDDGSTGEVVESPTSSTTPTQTHPDVVDVEVTSSGDDVYRFSVTMRSPYDSPERYADAWRVVGPTGVVYGVRVLLHDHADEQPFTRSLDGVEIPASVSEVTVEGRDLVNGWGGATVTVRLPR